MPCKNLSISPQVFALISLGCLVIATIIDEVVVISLMFAIIEKNYSPIAIAWLFFWQLVPAILIAPIAGLLIDNRGSRKTIIIVGLSQMLVLFWLSFSNSLWEIYFISALLSCHVAATGPAIFALISPMSKLANLSINKTNILLEATRSLGTIIGPAIGGVAIGLFEIRYIIMAASLWFGIFVIIIYLQKIDTTINSEKKPRLMLKFLKRSYIPILSRKNVMLVLFVFGAVVFATSFSDVLFVFFTLGPLDGSPSTVGVLIAIWSIGLLCGAASLGKFFKPKQEDNSLANSLQGAVIMGIALLFSGLSTLFLSVDFAVLAVLVLFFIGGLGNGIHNVSVRNVIYLEIPEGQHGRAFSLYIAITRIGALLGFFIGGLLSSIYAVEGYIFSGLLAILVGVTGLALRARLTALRKGYQNDF